MSILNAFPPTATRVQINTGDRVNERIRRRTGINLARYADKSPAEISARIRQLDREWDIERTLEANAALMIFSGLALGLLVDKKWLALSGIASGFLIQHALQGWCPPVSLFRSLGVRTYTEISKEKTALKQMRGDFTPTAGPAAALARARLS